MLTQNTHYLELLFVFLDMSCKAHWEKIYKEKSSQEVSWTQETPTTSIDFFSDFKIQKDDPIIDVGCGESKFVDYLIDNGYKDISVLDISENAISRAKQRIGSRSKFINWIICDINDFEPITGSIHQPPPVHQTFQSSGFVVCSFVSRLLENASAILSI